MKITNLFCLALIVLLVSNGVARSISEAEEEEEEEEEEFRVGDMKFDKFTYMQRHLPADSELVSTGIFGSKYRWPKNSAGLVQVPYFISSIYSASQKSTILAGMKLISSRTCIRFIPRTSSHANYLRIFKGSGCWSYVGRQGGMQEISLGSGCVYPEIAAHELIHALGFDHMHSRADRDNFLIVYLQNVPTSEHSQFDKVNPAYYGNFNTSYDFQSVMHYDRIAFSKNGLDTMYPLSPNEDYADLMGIYEVLSSGDVTRIKNMYKC